MDINNLWSGYDLNSKKQNSRCLAVNTILEGKYLVGPVLGQGGFGITYVGYDLNMEAKIAIKEYFPVELVSRDTTTMHGDRVLSLSGEKSVTYKAGLKKYVAEAQNVSQFSEIPGVVSVKDFFYANETAYIVMEFIDGISLKDYLKEKGGRLSEEETLKIMKPVLEALVQVHKAGIIHRDISPDNIMLTFKDGNVHNQIESVKLIDFGAARMTEKNDQKSLTIILKHGYAPEEQYRTHGEQGAWTDVYALCAVIYRMLTGETPVPAMDRMFKDELKTIEQCGAKVNANTADAILKGLAVKKDDRIQSVQELLGTLYEGAKIKSVKTSKIPLIAVGIAAAAVLGIAVVGFLSSDKNKNVVSEQAAVESESVKEDITSTTMTESFDSTGEDMVDFQEEEESGEQIVFYSPMNSIAGAGRYTLFCMPDGTVKARGNNDSGQCDVEEWDHVVAVSAAGGHSLGLRIDGTVVATGMDYSGQCGVEQWKDIVAIETFAGVSFGVTKDGNIMAAGETGEKIDLTVITSWTDIKDIVYGYDEVIGLKKDGTLVFEGEIDKTPRNVNWKNVENILVDSNILLGIEADGNVHAVTLDPQEYIEQEDLDYYNNLEPIKQLMVDSSIGVNAEGEARAISPLKGNITFASEVLEKAKNHIDLSHNMLAVYEDWNGYIYGITENGDFLEYYLNTGGSCEWEELQNLQQICLVMDRGNGGPGIIAQARSGELMYYGNMTSVREFCEQVHPKAPIKQYASSANLREMVLLLEDGTTVSSANWFPKTGVKRVVYGDLSGCMVFLMEDGTVELYPGDEYMSKSDVPHERVFDWRDVREIWTGNGVQVDALFENGDILRMDYGDLMGQLEIDEDTQIFVYNEDIIGLTKEGKVEILRMSDTSNESGKYQLEGWVDIVDIAIGATHTIGLKKDGTVVAAGSNHCGQCDVDEWKDIVAIDAIGQCAIGLTKDGNLLMAGTLCE